MDERPHDQGPGDAPAREGVPEGDGAAGPARAAGLTKDAKALAPPASAVPYALWPRAAGGGAGAVSVPVALDAGEDMGCRVADAAPMAPDQLAEAVIDAPEPPQVSPQAQLAEAADEPAPSVGADGAGTLVLPAAPALEAEPIGPAAQPADEEPAQAADLSVEPADDGLTQAAEPSPEPADNEPTQPEADTQLEIASPAASAPPDLEAPPLPPSGDQEQEPPLPQTSDQEQEPPTDGSESVGQERGAMG